MTHYIGIDMGGTKILGGRFTASGDLIASEQAPTYPIPDSDPFAQLVAFIQRLQGDDALQGIGIGVPGAVVDGQVNLAAALAWDGFPLVERLQQQFDVAISAENDVNLAALGEHRFGRGRGTQNMLCIAVGTGIGAGLILNGMLYQGYQGVAGEVGYMLPDVASLDQTYDDFGALELIAGGHGIAQRARNRYGNDVTAAHVFQQSRAGDLWAIKLVRQVADALALMIGNISMILAPERVILSGSVMQSADVLLPRIRSRLTGSIPIIPDIVTSQLGAQAALYGAVSLVLPQHE